jgi:hypothetical protein
VLNGGAEIIADGALIPFNVDGPYADGVTLQANDTDFLVTVPGFYLVSVTLNYTDANIARVAIRQNTAPIVGGIVRIENDGFSGAVTLQVVVNASINDVVTVQNLSTQNTLGLFLQSNDTSATFNMIKLN